MSEANRWLTFAGTILIVAVLYWGRVVIVPVAVAGLLTFVLSPAVAPLQRRLGGVVAVLLVVVLTFGALGVAGWAVTTQVSSLVQELPTYKQNIRQKIRDLRWLGEGGVLDAVQDTVEDIETEIAKGSKGTSARPIVVEPAPVTTLWGLPTAIGPWLEPAATTGLVMVLVVFMLLERQDLRNRLITLFDPRHLTITTRALDEAGRRVSRYLLVQALINLFVGLCVGVGLWAIGVPYAILWAALAAVLRFIPYVGPWIAALAPILVSLAAFEGWTRPLLVVALYAGLELFTNVVVESVFYAGAAGVSQVGLLVAVAFWTWLWGPLGLVLATPLTVCLVVIGKYVPGLDMVATMMADDVVLESDLSYYQRLLAGDQAEAADLLEQHVRESPDTVYDAMIIPALNYAERDRVEGRLTVEEERGIVEASSDLLADADELPRTNGGSPDAVPHTIPVLGWPARSGADALALQMLGALLARTPFDLEVLPAHATFADGVRALRERRHAVVCIAHLPPSGPSKSRYLVKRLRAAFPELTIVVGRWAPPPFADESVGVLREAGADHVASTLVETRDELVKRVEAPAAAAASDEVAAVRPGAEPA
jgi:predicted PurR-regulated permease PerM